MPHLELTTLDTFLLRCWQEPSAGQGGKSAWRFTLVQAEGERGSKGFAYQGKLVKTLMQALIQST